MAKITRSAVAASLLCALAAPLGALASDRFPEATPESQGMSSDALEQLGAVVEGYHDRGMVVGAELLVIKNRRTVYHGLYGDRDKEDGLPWTDDTICNIRSMSKTFTGAAAQILIDRGRLALDDKVSQYLPGFDNDQSRDITVGQLLTHRSGLPLTVITEDVNQYETLFDQANAAGEHGPDAEPGSKFWYSDAGTDVLGAVVEVVSGMTLDKFVTNEIFEPMGLADTFYGIDSDEPRLARVSSLYLGATNAWGRYWQPADGAFYPCAWGSQTIYGTPEDYAALLAMWMDDGMSNGKRILSHEAVVRTLTPASPMSMLGSDERFPTSFDGLESYYGMMSVLHMPIDAAPGTPPTIIGHSGSDGTIAWAWPGEDLMILYFTQSRGGMTPLRIEEDINNLIIHPGSSENAEAVPDGLKPCLGVYIANFATFQNERFEVRYDDGKLVLDIPSQMAFELLEPGDNGRWAFAIAPNQVSVEFVHEESGAVNMIRLHQGPTVFDIPREGTALAIEQSKPIEVDPVVIERITGDYRDPESGAPIHVFVEEDTVCIQREGALKLHLRPTEEPYTWLVREAPQVALAFELDGDRITSMTRIVAGDTLTLPRIVGGADEAPE